ncbi:hypothetical protein IFM89_010337 [Coptis chinensis]|uniref:Non-lysosomal glucosylceramidase n=1 Tax=Coptis chinensis TaxID=261450 RepID=A0A835LZ62_9MAGN|nr:hypothetical protein IFM89_010337 [Coptis chinensis]
MIDMVSGNIFHCRKHSWPSEEYISKTTLQLMRLGVRLWSYVREEASQGRKAPIDPFTRESCKPSASQGVPLGGMGSGSISRGFRGEFRQLQIVPGLCEASPIMANQFSYYYALGCGWDLVASNDLSKAENPFSFQNLNLFKNKEIVRMRKSDGQGTSSWGWNLSGQHSTYHALFPRAWTIYDGEPDPELKVSCRQISPFIPNNYRDSSLPAAVICVHVGEHRKRKGKSQPSSHLGSKDMWGTMVQGGHFDRENINVGASIPSSPGDTLCAAVSASAWVEAHGKCTVAFSLAWSSPKVKFLKGSTYNRRYTKFYGTSERSAVNLVHDALMNYKQWEEEIEKWQNPILRDDSLPEWYKFTLFNELYFLVAGGTVWIDGHLPAADDKSNLDGYRHKLKDVDNLDAKIITAKVNVNQGVVVQHDRINGFSSKELDRINGFSSNGVIDENEDTYQGSLHSSESVDLEETRRTNSLHGPKDDDEDVGRFLYLEGVEYIMWCTYDVHFYASFALLALFPKIELSIQRDFAKAVLSEDGRKVKFLADGTSGIRKARGAVPHDLGTHDPWHEMNAYNIHDTSRWKDLNPKFVLQVYRDFAATGNMSFAVDVWPAVCAAIEYMEQFDKDGDGLIENDGFPDQTYDAWTVHGISAYCGCLWLAALEAAAAMAHQLGDKAFAERCRSKFLKAKPVFEEKLWNGSYFNYDSGSSSNSRSIQADQLAGQWYIASSGLPSLFDDSKIRSALQKIFDFNVMRVKGGRIGAVNGMYPNGKVDESCMQSREIWTGVTYGLAATMILTEMKDEAFTTAEGIFTAGWSEEGYGYWFQTPEGWTVDGHYRSLIYMRPLAIWAMQWALALPKAILQAPGINMMDKMYTSSNGKASTNDIGGVRKLVKKTKCFSNAVFHCSC